MGKRKEIIPISHDDRVFFESFYQEHKRFMYYTLQTDATAATGVVMRRYTSCSTTGSAIMPKNNSALMIKKIIFAVATGLLLQRLSFLS